MKKSNWVLYIDGILGVIISIGGGIMYLAVAPTAVNTTYFRQHRIMQKSRKCDIIKL